MGGEVRLLEVVWEGVGVFGAETSGGVGDSVTATATSARAVLTAGQVVGGARVDGWFVLGDPQL